MLVNVALSALCATAALAAPRYVEFHQPNPAIVSQSHSKPLAKRGSTTAPSGFNWGNEKIRGVNIGGWLVLEPWVCKTPTNPVPAWYVLDPCTIADIRRSRQASSRNTLTLKALSMNTLSVQRPASRMPIQLSFRTGTAGSSTVTCRKSATLVST